MSMIRDVEWGSCLLEKTSNPELERELRERYGRLPDIMAYYYACPWLARALVATHHYVGMFAYIDQQLAELMWLTVSQDQSCRYCYASQRMTMRLLGVPETTIARLERDLFTTELSRERRMALELVERVSRSNPLVSRSDLEPLFAVGYEESFVKEAIVFAAITVAGNRSTTIPALPLTFVEKVADRWYVKLMRPLLARRIRRRIVTGRPVRLRPEQHEGPFAYLTNALDGLPAAPRMRGVIDDAWSSPAISKRLRSLMSAVIARGLGCPLAEEESIALLEAEGFERSATLEVLENLGSPALDPVETAVVRFARETIWYQPVRVQRRAAELRELLTAEQFVDVIGTVSLANALCRCGVVAEQATG
jgi:alkylhydroperoxidase family enzyme